MIYFLLVDRFYNGDPSNDSTINLNDPQAFHGGDLRGVSERLDYLEELGVETLWLGPITKMRTEPFYEWGAYHGYWLEDPYELEPRFGDWAALEALQRGLHKRKIKLILDVVYNHVAPESPRTQTHAGWFHHFGPITDWHNAATVQTHDVHGLPDLDQTNPEVYSWLLDSSLAWLERIHPAGFRIDAVRHMPAAFLAQIGGEIRKRAGRGFELWGEIFDGNLSVVAETKKTAGLDAVFDYPLHYALIDVVCKNQPAALIAAALDRTRGSAANEWITFVDNHDTSRVTAACEGDHQRVDLALELLFSLRGRPMLTWGTEWGFDGAKEPENRADMRWTEPWPMDRMALLRRIISRRRDDPVLRDGDWRTVGLGLDWFVIERRLGADRRWIVYNSGEQRELNGITFDANTVSVLRDPPRVAKSPRKGVLHVSMSSVAADPSDEYRLVGDAAELGAWKPEHGVVLPAKIRVSDEAYVFKLVQRQPDGTFVWEPGPNRWILGASGPAKMEWGKVP